MAPWCTAPVLEKHLTSSLFSLPLDPAWSGRATETSQSQTSLSTSWNASSSSPGDDTFRSPKSSERLSGSSWKGSARRDNRAGPPLRLSQSVTHNYPFWRTIFVRLLFDRPWVRPGLCGSPIFQSRRQVCSQDVCRRCLSMPPWEVRLAGKGEGTPKSQSGTME